MDDFETWVLARPSAASTARAYHKDLRHLHAVHGGALDPRKLTKHFSRGVSVARRNREACAYQAWQAYCASRGVETPPLEYQVKNPPKRVPKTLEPEDFEALLAAARGMGRRGDPARLMLLAGLRRSEARSVKVRDVVRRSGQRLLRVVGKGDKERHVTVAGDLEGCSTSCARARTPAHPCCGGRTVPLGARPR